MKLFVVFYLGGFIGYRWTTCGYSARAYYASKDDMCIQDFTALEVNQPEI